MWNAMQTKSLVGALLITAMIQGSLLWGINNVATAGTSGLAETQISNRLTPLTAASPEISYVTLEPVLIVGERNPLLADSTPAQTSALALAGQGWCTNASVSIIAANRQEDRQVNYC